jgi:dTMP kinase
MLLDPARYGELTPISQMLGFELDRAITAASLIGPALTRGEWVVSDRHHFGTIAYQAFGGGVALDLVDLLNDGVLGSRYPDLSIVLDLPIAVARERQRDRTAIDRFDEMGVDFQERVREGFRFAASRRGAAAVVLDASQAQDAVFAEAIEAIKPLLSSTEAP